MKVLLVVVALLAVMIGVILFQPKAVNVKPPVVVPVSTPVPSPSPKPEVKKSPATMVAPKTK